MVFFLKRNIFVKIQNGIIMKTITLEIPENKLAFFMELFEQLKLNVLEDPDIQEWQKEEVLDRMKKSDKTPERLLEWEKIKHQIKS